jgi:hypothetical protein
MEFLTESNHRLDREQAIALLVSLVAFDANSEKKMEWLLQLFDPLKNS